MVRNKFLMLLMICSLFLAQSCIHGDLDDCPPMVSYSVAFEYTNHTGTKDRFYDDVKKIDLYVFDENGLVYTIETAISPFDMNFTIPLENIPMGNYDIIAWGNIMEKGDFDFPKKIDKGMSFDETRLYLQREANNLSDEALDKLFFGILRDVEIPLYVSRTDTMPLINNTNNVRVVLHWDQTGEAEDVNGIIDYDSVKVALSASNAEYGFNNNFTSANNVIYRQWAYYSSDSILNADKNEWLTMYYYPDGIEKITASTVYDFSILRMALGSPIYLTVERGGFNLPGNTDLLSGQTIDIMQTFITYFDDQGVSALQRQNMFDKNEYYRIDIYLTYNRALQTYVTGSIQVEPWKKVDQGEVPMN